VLIVLTGMGRDGHDGAAHVARAGGLVVAQDAGSSRANGMPRAVYEGGLAHAVLPPPSIASLMRELSAGRSCA
jgi:two-component system chemotaxis response regulator CheB